MKLIIEDDEGRRTIVPFLGEALNIGRADDNHVRLGEKNVSRKHGRILRKSGLFVVEDLSTFAGIRVNGEKVRGKRQVKEGDLIQISEFDLQLQAGPDDGPKLEEQPPPPPMLDEEDNEPTITQKDPPKDEELEARKHEETAVIKIADIAPALKAAEAVEVAEAERPKLVGIEGALRGTSFTLMRSPISIGRALENDVCLDHPQVSRSHCRLALINGSWKVIDAESRHGVKVNGEPYAASPLHHGDLLEVGPVHLIYGAPGKAVELPAEPQRAPLETPIAPAPPISTPLATARVAELRAEPSDDAAKSSGLPKGVLIAAGVVIAVTLALLMVGRQHASSPESTDAADAALQRAGSSAAAHRYREAVRGVQAAIAAGAPAEKTRALPSLEMEARAEEQYEQLVQAIARADFDAARSLLDRLSTVPTWYGGRALEHTQEVKTGYVKLHVERANSERGRDDAACLTEANLALAANPQSDAARSLVAECGGGARSIAKTATNAGGAVAAPRAALPAPKAEAPAARTPGVARPAPAVAAADSSGGNEDEARRLLHEGSLKVSSGDYSNAIADFERALALHPSAPMLGSLYRALGTTYSRTGNADKGANYYRLYLPYCANPTEKAFLQKTLDDYDASRGSR